MRVPNSGFRFRHSTFTTLTLLCCAAIAACTRSSPTHPDSIDLGVVSSTARSAQRAPETDALDAEVESSSDVRRPPTTVDLIGGTLRLTAANGDLLTATYTGRVTTTGGASRVSLDLRVTGGSGQFQGAAGTLQGDGSGEFAGEGTFSLALQGSLTLTGKKGASNFRVHLRGTSLVSCLDGRTSIALQGEGNSNRSGNVTGTLTHQATNSGCTA